jgi:hypothetical protein
MILDMSDALRALIEDTVKNLSMPNSAGGNSAPEVYDAFVPKKRRGGEEPKLPFVVVRPSKGSDDPPDNGAYQSTVEAMILIAVHREFEDGYRDVVTILEKIRTRLLSYPVFGDRYRVERPVSWEVSEDDTWPNWYGVLTLQVTIPQPIELDNLNATGIVYGETYPTGRP